MRALLEDFSGRRQRPAISGRNSARCPGAARMGCHAQGGRVERMAAAARTGARRLHVWGPLSALGLAVALLTVVADQASKLWLLYGFDLERRVRVALTPFIDLVVTWNTGISYGLFQQHGRIGVWALLAFKLVVLVLLWVWLARVSSRLRAVALGLIIGGAIGNAIDSLH